MVDERHIVDRLRNYRSRYICDREFSISQITADCAEAADFIELLLDELEKQQIENLSMKTELDFTREFISRNGLQYALASDWNKATTVV